MELQSSLYYTFSWSLRKWLEIVCLVYISNVNPKPINPIRINGEHHLSLICKYQVYKNVPRNMCHPLKTVNITNMTDKQIIQKVCRSKVRRLRRNKVSVNRHADKSTMLVIPYYVTSDNRHMKKTNSTWHESVKIWNTWKFMDLWMTHNMTFKPNVKIYH